MKALILAAGFGTRLLPYTMDLPKPLFPIYGQALLDRHIRTLIRAGCSAIMVNTHHLAGRIDSFLDGQFYPVPVQTRFEPYILGTGGAIKNAADFWDAEPFFVINSDIVFDIDLSAIYAFHLEHRCPVTMVLCDYPEFNMVSVKNGRFVTGFSEKAASARDGVFSQLAFTGIQVLDQTILDYIPQDVFYTSIDAYKELIRSGGKIKAYTLQNDYWQDIGTPRRYQQAVCDIMAPKAFRRAFACDSEAADIFPYQRMEPFLKKLKGDGSDRTWCRMTMGSKSLILANHGLKKGHRVTETDAFIAIGRHLEKQNIPVPKIYLADEFSGLVFVEDLGDVNLQDIILREHDTQAIIEIYLAIIDQLILLSTRGGEGFNVDWAYQSPAYTPDMIRKYECRYFTDAFLNTLLRLDVAYDTYADEFSHIARNAVEHASQGFMHRDFQSRNIMVKNDRFYFIDFQGGRIGPIEYDLASLLIDPYVGLPDDLQSILVEECYRRLSAVSPVNETHFFDSYRYCAVTRNLQMLGAFAFLSCVKGKNHFRRYIPVAVERLQKNLKRLENPNVTRLMDLIESIDIGDCYPFGSV